MLAFKKAARIGLAIPLGNPLTPGADEAEYRNLRSNLDDPHRSVRWSSKGR